MQPADKLTDEEMLQAFAKNAEYILELEQKIEDFESRLSGFLQAYPEDVFPEPTKEDYKKAHELLSQISPTFGSRLFGAWGRHIATQIKNALHG